MPPLQQQRAQQRGWTILCYLILGFLLVAGLVVLIAWISSQPRYPPCFAAYALYVPSGGQVAFIIMSDSYTNHQLGISYKGATRASLLFHDATVASGQANRGTYTIIGVLDVVDEPSFNATLRGGGGSLPLRLLLTTEISFRLLNVFPPVKQNMYVNCDLLVRANGKLRRESVGAPCDTYFWPLDVDDY